MEAAITARSSCARMAYTANARATTTIREINHRIYFAQAENVTFFGSRIHSRYLRQPSIKNGTKTTLTNPSVPSPFSFRDVRTCDDRRRLPSLIGYVMRLPRTRAKEVSECNLERF